MHSAQSGSSSKLALRALWRVPLSLAFPASSSSFITFLSVGLPQGSASSCAHAVLATNIITMDISSTKSDLRPLPSLPIIRIAAMPVLIRALCSRSMPPISLLKLSALDRTATY